MPIDLLLILTMAVPMSWFSISQYGYGSQIKFLLGITIGIKCCLLNHVDLISIFVSATLEKNRISNIARKIHARSCAHMAMS
jgi:hypothetical protein